MRHALFFWAFARFFWCCVVQYQSSFLAPSLDFSSDHIFGCGDCGTVNESRDGVEHKSYRSFLGDEERLVARSLDSCSSVVELCSGIYLFVPSHHLISGDDGVVEIDGGGSQCCC